ncbi:MAG TPA: hypothetical protein DCG30_06825 [Ruminococcus sp.]|nr:hypothetical protein [Ruminococcus sp.]
MSKQIFISYRREGGEFLAKIIYDELTRNGYSVFFDIESMRSGRFNEQLYEEIKKSNDFLLILTPDCLDRCKNSDDWVRLEYEHAVKCGKNIIPILTRGFEFHEGNLPDSMKDLPMYERIEASADGMETAMKKLKRMIKSAPNTELSETDKHSEIKTLSKLGILITTSLIFMILYFFVIAPKFMPNEILWLTAFLVYLSFGIIGLYLTSSLKSKRNLFSGLFLSGYFLIFAVLWLICDIFYFIK